MSSHEDEIHFIEHMAARGASTANYIINGPEQSEAVRAAIEGPNSTTTEEAGTPRNET